MSSGSSSADMDCDEPLEEGSDFDYTLAQSDEDDEEEEEGDSMDEAEDLEDLADSTYFIVAKEALMKLFKFAHCCGALTTDIIVKEKATLVSVTTNCLNGHTNTWKNQEE